MHHLYDYMYTLGFEPKTLVATGSNCTDSCNATTKSLYTSHYFIHSNINGKSIF